MVLNTDNLSSSGKTPQQELEELLASARSVGRVKPAVIARPGTAKLSLPGLSKGMEKNLMAILVAVLAVVLMFGTGYFVVAGLRSNTGIVVLESNEQGVGVSVNHNPQGVINSGNQLRLKAGENLLAFTKEGFLEQEVTVKVVTGESQTVTINMLPVPTIEKVAEGNFNFVRLNKDGSEIAYLDQGDRTFKTTLLSDKSTVNLFKGSFGNVSNVAWSSAAQLAIVQLSGQYSLPNMIDNRKVLGHYVLLGERPSQGPAKSNGIATWFFDDSRKIAETGWQPILLTENIRQIAYSIDGSMIVYIYETGDGERSLVRALPDGTEWERMITDLPSFDAPKLTWSADDRYLLIEDKDKLFVADLVNGSVLDVFPDRTPNTPYSLSNEGDQLAYLAGDKVRVYQFLDNTTKDIPELFADQSMVFTWLDTNNLVIALPNQSFVKVDVNTGQKLTIPFVGTDGTLEVKSLMYSRAGQVLMLNTATGIYTMKI